VASDGGVFAYGDAPYLGSATSLHLAAPIVGVTATPNGNGYDMVGADGGVFNYGDAAFLGSAATLHLAAPVTGLTGTATSGGPGYWLVGADGGVFNYGVARYSARGSAPAGVSFVAVAAAS
jgi:hypothetical protein